METLPGEILQIIAFSLDYRDIVNLCCSASFLNLRISRDRGFWKLLFRRDLSVYPREDDFDYRKEYQAAMVDRFDEEDIEYAVIFSNEKQLEKHKHKIKTMKYWSFGYDRASAKFAKFAKVHVVEFFISVLLDIIDTDRWFIYIDWNLLSGNPNITCEFIEKYIHTKKWNWLQLSKNPNINDDFVKRHINESWDKEALLQNPNITIVGEKEINQEWSVLCWKWDMEKVVIYGSKNSPTFESYEIVCTPSSPYSVGKLIFRRSVETEEGLFQS